MTHLKQNLCAVLAAFIWGTAFAAQSASADIVPPFAFNGSRSIVAAAFLVIVVFALNGKNTVSKFNQSKKNIIIGGICCGLALFAATNLQQLGFVFGTTAGKSGFITALYIVLVPIFGLLFKKKVPFTVWISVALSAAGLYMLCVNETLTVQKGDFFVILCSVMFAVHILVVDNFVSKADGVMLSMVQFLTVGILSFAVSFVFEDLKWADIVSCAFPILYVGIMSSGIAYTLQIVAQKDSNPTVISLLLSLESVFAVVSGAIILKETMVLREYIGCVVMLFAVILAQIPVRKNVL